MAGLEAVAYRFALIHELLKPTADPDHRIHAVCVPHAAAPVNTPVCAARSWKSGYEKAASVPDEHDLLGVPLGGNGTESA